MKFIPILMIPEIVPDYKLLMLAHKAAEQVNCVVVSVQPSMEVVVAETPPWAKPTPIIITRYATLPEPYNPPLTRNQRREAERNSKKKSLKK